MSNIDKIIDRVRKMLALAANAGTEAEAANAAARAQALMAQHQLDEAQLRVADASLPPEPIERSARLEPDAPETGRKRVAWREAIALAVARDVGVHMWWNTRREYDPTTGRFRKSADVRGFGRESSIQTWRYVTAYLWRTIDELAEGANAPAWQSTRAWRNAYRVGCAQRIAERIYTAGRERERAKVAVHDVADECRHRRRDDSGTCRDCGLCDAEPREPSSTSQALVLVERDREEVDREYAAFSRRFGTVASIGSTSSASGYEAGREAGDSVKLSGARAGLPAGQGRLKKGGN